MCGTCIVSAHAALPLHRIRRWNDQYWEDSSLFSLGLTLEMCHSADERCNAPLTAGNVLVVGDISGFHQLQVRFCEHPGVGSRALQLLRAGFFPCSDDTPRSAFTVACLEHFDLFNTLGAMSGQKYYDVLVKLTSAGFPHTVDNRYRELHLTHRRYCHLKNLKRSGSTYEQQSPEECFQDHAVHCIGCPLPKFNYNPKSIPDRIREFFRGWFGYDGNFANDRKNKKVDVDDVCLSDGRQYYVKHKEYEEWAKVGGKERVKGVRPECDNHKAARSDQFGTWGGLDVTGIGLFTCTRHSVVLPKGLVDFWGGEKYRFCDYAFGSIVNYKLRHGPQSFGMTYDIWCHWIVNRVKRSLELPAHVATPKDIDLVGGIPKWHLVGHKRVCHVRYSLNYMQYVGRMDGEGPERFWAYLNQTCGSTSEKSPGFRRDSINNVIDSWNFAKMIGFHKHLDSAFLTAKKMYIKQKTAFQEFTASLPTEDVRDWSQEPLEAVLVNNKWESPFFEKDNPVASFADALQLGRSLETSETNIPARKVGAAQWIASAIELEHSMHKVQKHTSERLESLSADQLNELHNKKSRIRSRFNKHQQLAAAYMGDSVAPDHPSRQQPPNSEPENSVLGLPSDYRPQTLAGAGLSSMAELELTFRRATCDDALQTLRNLLGVKAWTIKFVRANLSGEEAVTRAQSELKEHNKKISAIQWRYKNSREALLRLGGTAEDLVVYQEITPSDLKYLKVYLQEESGRLGEGYRSIPWLWRTSRITDAEEWQTEAVKAEWFRSRERFRRWEEELMLLKREMVMARNSLRSLESVWRARSKSSHNQPGMSEYAARKTAFYRKLGHQIYDTCRDHIKDNVIEFEWCDGWRK